MSKNEDPPSYNASTNKEHNPVSISHSVAPTVTTVIANRFAPSTVSHYCPYCHAQIRTLVKAEPTPSTHVWALLLCCLFTPCVCLPYCIDSCQNINHYCPTCKAFLGTYNNRAD